MLPFLRNIKCNVPALEAIAFGSTTLWKPSYESLQLAQIQTPTSDVRNEGSTRRTYWGRPGLFFECEIIKFGGMVSAALIFATFAQNAKNLTSW